MTAISNEPDDASFDGDVDLDFDALKKRAQKTTGGHAASTVRHTTRAPTASVSRAKSSKTHASTVSKPKASASKAATLKATSSKATTLRATISKASASKASNSKAGTTKATTSKASASKAATSKAATTKATTSKAVTSKAAGSKAVTSKVNPSTASKSKASPSKTSASKSNTPSPSGDYLCSQSTCGRSSKNCPAKSKQATGAQKNSGASSRTKRDGDVERSRADTQIARAIFHANVHVRGFVERITRRFTSLLTRAPTINLSASALKQAVTQAKKALEESKGKYRYLLHGVIAADAENPKSPIRTPNDQAWDAFAKDEFYRTVDDLEGCMAIMVASPKGIFTLHFWENIMRDEAGMQSILSNIAKGQPDEPNPAYPDSYAVKAQFGLQNFQSDGGQVSNGAWTDIAKVKIAVVAPNAVQQRVKKTDPQFKATEILPQAKWNKQNLRYPDQMLSILNAVKKAIDADAPFPDGDIILAAYTRQLGDDDTNTFEGFDASMTAYFDGKNNYAFYAADKKLLEGSISSAVGKR